MKKVLIWLVALFLTLTRVSPVWAGENILVTCDVVGCRANSDRPLFAETAFAPGQTAHQTLEVFNHRSETCYLHLKINEKNRSSDFRLQDKITFKIRDDGTTYFGVIPQTLADLYQQHDVGAGGIEVGQSKVLTWDATLDPNLGNEYQGATTSFDFDLNVECGRSDGGSGGPSSTGGVLGTTTDSGSGPKFFANQFSEPENQPPNPNPVKSAGEVQGAATDCAKSQTYWFIFLLLSQTIIQLLNENLLRRAPKRRIVGTWIAIEVVVLLIWWFTRQPECQTSYFVILSLVLFFAIRLFGHLRLSKRK